MRGTRKTQEERIRYFVSTKGIEEGLAINIVGGVNAVHPRVVMVRKVVGETIYYLELNQANIYDHVNSKNFRCFGYYLDLWQQDAWNPST